MRLGDEQGTTFLTTVWEDTNGSLQHLTQGKSILMSHKRGQATHRGTGFWGVKKNCLPLVGQANKLPAWLRREKGSAKDTGTTLSILGFSPPKNWEKILAGSIAESFFASIHRGNLEVDIEGEPLLQSATLPDLFSNDAVRDALQDQKDEPDAFLNSGHFLHALTSSESKIEETENAGLGRCRLHILVGENLPKKVAVLRNGMLITSELERLRRFSEFKEFSAVLECLSDKGNALLRDMEPPAHDDFQPARLLTADQQRVARIALRELAQWVRDMLKRHAQDPIAEVTELDELAEFFGDDENDGGLGARDGDENPRGALKIRARPLPPRKPKSPDEQPGVGVGEGEGTEGDVGGGDDGQGQGEGDGGEQEGNDGNEGDGTSDGGGGGGVAVVSRPSMALRNVRAVVTAPSGRRVSFTPEAGGSLRLELEDSGADTNRLLRIAGASGGTIVDGRLKLACEAGQRITLDLTLERAFEGTIRVKANAI
ncbi:hypothetical protein [Aquincola sp. J276]|uniref:hypothetical protein n=1 Tax=Aquincola sp. J276 TaxID=2898432 RepID=UPI00215089E4|nr:hypothetical protein [Aquincola sp. J276]MCR5868490.1 hypothetical protein [Aquincola sp. J276]